MFREETPQWLGIKSESWRYLEARGVVLGTRDVKELGSLGGCKGERREEEPITED